MTASDPADVYRDLIEALNTKVALISTVQDIPSARAVSDRFPDADRLHNTLADQYRNSLLTEAQRKELEQQFGTRQAKLEKAWIENYSRVAFIPGAWENMHPELAPFADLASYPDDAAGLEAAIVERLRKSIEIQRQVTDVNTAKKWGPQYRVASARIGVLLGRHNQARGTQGGRDADTPAIQQLRREFDAQRQRINGIPDATRLLNGETPRQVSVVSLETSADWQPIVTELQSGDMVRVRNTLNQMSGMNPPPPWKSHVFPELIKLLAFEPVRGSAAEALKKGWFSDQQALQVLDAADLQQDRGSREMLYEGVSRVPGQQKRRLESERGAARNRKARGPEAASPQPQIGMIPGGESPAPPSNKKNGHDRRGMQLVGRGRNDVSLTASCWPRCPIRFRPVRSRRRCRPGR